MIQLSNNIVFITGGSSGIGLALARAFLELQNTVIVCGRSLEKLEFVRKEYPDIHTFLCDITKDEDFIPRWRAVLSLKTVFHLVPDKDKAADDMKKLSEKGIVL